MWWDAVAYPPAWVDTYLRPIYPFTDSSISVLDSLLCSIHSPPRWPLSIAAHPHPHLHPTQPPMCPTFYLTIDLIPLHIQQVTVYTSDWWQTKHGRERGVMTDVVVNAPPHCLYLFHLPLPSLFTLYCLPNQCDG